MQRYLLAWTGCLIREAAAQGSGLPLCALVRLFGPLVCCTSTGTLCSLRSGLGLRVGLASVHYLYSSVD